MVVAMKPGAPPHNHRHGDGQGETDFGFERVPEGEKQGRVRGVFDRVAGRYDLMNDLMSVGVHRLWKTALVDWLRPRPGMRHVDVAGGTGDIAFRILDRLAALSRRRGGHDAPLAEMIVCDINPAMLAEGRRRAAARARRRKPVPAAWLCCNAEGLPLAEGAADAYTIAFGIRNVTHIERALAEAHRVLKPGGRFLCLEFSAAQVPGLDRLYDAYSFNVIPHLGKLVAGDGAPYRYLVESIRKFPDQQAFAAMIETAGFARVNVRNLSGGIAALHSGYKL